MKATTILYGERQEQIVLIPQEAPSCYTVIEMSDEDGNWNGLCTDTESIIQSFLDGLKILGVTPDEVKEELSFYDEVERRLKALSQWSEVKILNCNKSYRITVWYDDKDIERHSVKWVGASKLSAYKKAQRWLDTPDRRKGQEEDE